MDSLGFYPKDHHYIQCISRQPFCVIHSLNTCIIRSKYALNTCILLLYKSYITCPQILPLLVIGQRCQTSLPFFLIPFVEMKTVGNHRQSRLIIQCIL